MICPHCEKFIDDLRKQPSPGKALAIGRDKLNWKNPVIHEGEMKQNSDEFQKTLRKLQESLENNKIKDSSNIKKNSSEKAQRYKNTYSVTESVKRSNQGLEKGISITHNYKDLYSKYPNIDKSYPNQLSTPQKNDITIKPVATTQKDVPISREKKSGILRTARNRSEGYKTPPAKIEKGRIPECKDDTPIEMANRLSEYVNELIEAKIWNNCLAIKGRTQMILTVLDKLKNAHEDKPLSQALIARMQKDKNRANLKLPKSSSNYLSYCWNCIKRLKIKVIVDKRVDSVCETCGWVQCPDCGACRDPKYGGCKDRVYLKKKRLRKY